MPDNATTPPPAAAGGCSGCTRRPAASWSERASNGASSALAPAPGVAEEEAGRQGAPEPEEGVAERSLLGRTPQPDTDSAPRTPSRSADRRQPPVEQPSWREPDAPPLPALMNRKRTMEKRDQEKSIRFTRDRGP